MKPGRPSQASLNVVPMDQNRRRLKASPVYPLTKPQRKVFNETYMKHEHLTPADSVLIGTYSIVVAKLDAIKQASNVKVADLDKLSRLIVSLSRALRLAPQSRVDPKTLSRAVNNKHCWPDDAE